MHEKSERFLELKLLLDTNKYFKVICGAGNENPSVVEKVTTLYTLAGANVFDVSANVEIIKAAKSGIDKAFIMSRELGIIIENKPFIMISVGMPGDHHVRKSYIDPLTCIACGLCAPVCPTDAIPYDFHQKIDFFKELKGSYEKEEQEKEIVLKKLCIGCGKCSSICPKNDVIFYRHDEKELREILPECLAAGAECIELHAAITDDESITKEWKLINEINKTNYNSLCLDRLHLGNFQLENRIQKMKDLSNGNFIVQADGYPMSGGADDYNTTLQAIACADIINKKFNIKVRRKKDGVRKKINIHTKKVWIENTDNNHVYVTISGGTNSLSRKLANQCGVRINGVAVGTYARGIVEKYLISNNFYEKDNLQEAIKIANNLVISNIESGGINGE